MTALYNEIEPFAAQWLRNLIDAGQIAPGVVDTRSIEDLEPDYVRQFTQVHLFAGIGIWSKALRRAGWADDRRVLTGSCPCQPFSAAGQGGGFTDERHLWPAMFHLVTQCDFDVVVGEQVASKDGLGWLDLVRSDMEAAGYAFAALDTCAAGFGAPHIRQRLHWVGRRELAHAGLNGSQGRTDLAGRDDHDGRDAGRPQAAGHAGARGGLGGLADADGGEQSGRRVFELGQQPGDRSSGERLADAGHAERSERRDATSDDDSRDGTGSEQGRQSAPRGGSDRPGPVNGPWRDADWLFCRDNKWRPVEPGAFPLAHALPRSLGAMGPGLRGLADVAGLDAPSLARAKRFRTGTLRGFGNAIVDEQTVEFLRALEPDTHA